jgi:ligand-binding sensor domain-containing protein
MHLRSLLLIICVFVFFGFPSEVSGQQFLYRNYSAKHGLPTSEIYDVLQDRKGYLWFATDGGVSRFDGYGFRNYTTYDGLPVNGALKLFEDKKGRIWFVMLGDHPLAWFENDSIHVFPHNKKLSKLLDRGLVNSILVDEKDRIHLGTVQGPIAKLEIASWMGDDMKCSVLEYQGLYMEISDDDVISGKVGNTERPAVIVTRNGLSLFQVPIDDYGNISRVSALKINNDTFCFATNYQVKVFSGSGKVLHTLDVPDVISSISFGNSGYLWIATYKGAYRYKLADLSSAPIRVLEKVLVSKVHEDREGATWITTTSEGIYYLTSTEFSNYTSADGLSGNKAVMLFPLNDEQLIAGVSDKGIDLIDIRKRAIKHITGPDNRNTGWSFTAGWFNAKKDTFFVSTGINGVFFFDSTGTIIHQWKNIYSNVKGYLYTRNGKRVVSTITGLSEFHNPPDHNQMTPCCLRSNSICEDSEGRIWAATSSGLYCYDNGRWENYGDKFPILRQHADDVEERVPGELWIATRGQGLLIFKSGKITRLTSEDGLAGNYCKALLIDKSVNTVWVGTGSGISRVTIEGGRYSFSSYKESSGLVCDEVNVMCWWGNNLCIGTNKGISVIDPAKLAHSAVPPPVYITGITINGHEASLARYYDLPHNRNHVVINFTGLSFKEPGKMTYRYRMQGLDTAWKYTTSPFVQYLSLPPGRFAFEVNALNNDMVSSVQPAVVRFDIAPPYWSTWWFAALMAALLIILSMSFVLYKVRTVRKREEEKSAINKKLAEAQLTALRAQMNPHFIFNALGSIQSFVLKNNTEQANSYLAKFSSLIRKVLQNSADSYISLEQELDTLKLYVELESLRFSNAFDYELKVDKDVDTLQEIPSMIIQPYIENAIWHGLMHKKEKGRLLVHIMNAEDGIVCIIEDNGVGRNASARSSSFRAGHKSMGMTVTKERLALLGHGYGNEIEIIDLYEGDSPAGTRVRLVIAASES